MSGHSRQSSYAKRQALPRRNTKGPLEEDSSPAASEDGAHSRQESVNSDLDVSESLSGKHERASSDGKAIFTPRISVAEQAEKDFSFLLRPDVYHDMNDSDMPLSFRSTHAGLGSEDALPEMLASGHFRTAAATAASLLKSSKDVTNYAAIFHLLYVRLVCLSLLDYHFEAAQESKVLQDFNGPYFRDVQSGVHIAPWTLRLLVVRLQAIGFGDWRRGIIGYYEMAREARWHIERSSSDDEKEGWKQRLGELGSLVGHALIEMGDLDAASRHLRSLHTPDDRSAASLNFKLALLSIRIGDTSIARDCLHKLESIDSADSAFSYKLLQALCEMAESQFDAAMTTFTDLSITLNDDLDTRKMVDQNKAVCLVYSGRVSEAREMLEQLTQGGSIPHGVTFNLATMFELTSENARNLKIALAQQIASHEPSSTGWEKFNADFKL